MNNKKIIIIILGVIFVCVSIYYFFIPNISTVEPFDKNFTTLIIESNKFKLENNSGIKDGEYFIPVDIVNKYIYKDIWWDKKQNVLTVTTKNKLIRMWANKNQATENQKPKTFDVFPVFSGNTLLVPINLFKEEFEISIKYNKENNVLIIDLDTREHKIAKIIKTDAAIRPNPSIREPIYENVLKGKEVFVYQEFKEWSFVRSINGTFGYIRNSDICEISVIPKKITKTLSNFKKNIPNKKIKLVWDMTYNIKNKTQDKSTMKGVNVISPTWFDVVNTTGGVINRANYEYVSWAHNSGYKVWPLVANDFSSLDNTSKFLNNTNARDNTIKGLVKKIEQYDLDGINIDFENIYQKDKDAYSQFIKELSVILNLKNRTLSVDITVPEGSENWSQCYDRKSIGEWADFVIIMAYDQYWATSTEPGSAAELPWVERNLNKTIQLIANEKIILGIPFYARLWKEQRLSSGVMKLSVDKVLTIEDAKKIPLQFNAKRTWIEEIGQFYTEYSNQGSKYKIWEENEITIARRIELINKYKLAGYGAWSKGFGSKGAFETIEETFKRD